ncbi:MAG: TnpV protein [Tissierellia bacterium]|nr:TnpV protein [Tissierellia bacterium]
MNQKVTLDSRDYLVEQEIYTPLIPENNFEKMGGTYLMKGEMLIPNMENKEEKLGKYARMREHYLKENKPVYYNSLIIEGTLMEYLKEVQLRAEELLEVETVRLQKLWEVTEELKAQDQMKWIGEMNNIKNSLEEVIQKEIIYI